MTKRLIKAPVGLPVSLAAAVSKARANGAGLDDEIDLDVRGIAGDVQHQLQRALVEQTWAVTLDQFPAAIKLPMAAPLIAVEHVKYFDVDGVLRTLDPQDYLVDQVSEPAYVLPAPGQAWPATADRINAVEVQYRCGYGADHTAVPPAIQSYILARIEAQHFPEQTRSAKYLDRLLDGLVVY
ncbi:hypothetical protein [uncultured Massilia sp.]|uniref:head-tail connector protein n=1 Tax=uncultured Massilia sp. TaxID=169973 RepID=UPI00258CA00D|nr:hypothetical protein [uncultured Massilia sp.]